MRWYYVVNGDVVGPGKHRLCAVSFHMSTEGYCGKFEPTISVGYMKKGKSTLTSNFCAWTDKAHQWGNLRLQLQK